MPILHRNVVPNVPALAADNGKIVFRDGRPSHQKKVKFRVELDWNPDFCDDSLWVQDLDYHGQFIRWAGGVPTAADLTAWLNAPVSAGDNEAYYNTPLGWSGRNAMFMRTGGLLQHPAPAGSGADYDWEFQAANRLYLVWDGNNNFWKWRFAIGTSGLVLVRRYGFSSFDEGATETLGRRTLIIKPSALYLDSANLDSDIRPGANGIALTQSASIPELNLSGATLYSEHTA